MNIRQIDYINNDLDACFNNTQAIQDLKNKVIYISGSSGFMGSWLLEAIRYLNESHGFNTKAYATAKEPELMMKRNPHLFSENVESLKIDVRSLFEIPSDVTHVVNLAGVPDVRVHASDPLRVMDTNIQGVCNMLSASSRLPMLEKFIHLSSGLIYGKVDSELITEKELGTLEMASPSTCYVESKRVAETYCQVYRSQFRMPIVTLRPFTFIGPHQSIEMPWAINNFIKDAINGGPIRILRNEANRRSCMYPADMVNLILRTMARGESGDSFNLGSDDSKSMSDIAEIVSRCFSKKIMVELPINKSTDKSIFVPSMKKSSAKLKFELKYNVETSIKKTIEWLKLS